MADMQNPGWKAGASRISLVGASAEAITLSTIRAQYLIGSYRIRPELAAILAAVAFGGGAA